MVSALAVVTTRQTRSPKSFPDRPQATGTSSQLADNSVELNFTLVGLPQQRAKLTANCEEFRCTQLDTLGIATRVFAATAQCRQLKALSQRSIPRQPVHNPPIMRVLIADRNARLLESISRTFAHQFNIQTASTDQECGELLRQGTFDLAIICEKLADGPGLKLLGQIARTSPDTLRIFAARQSRLQLLKGRLGHFGLFRTLSYPFDAQKLLSALTLARAGLEIDVPELKIPHVVIENRPAGDVPPTLEKAAVPLQAPRADTPTPGPTAVRPTIKRPLSLEPADAMFSANVPMTIESMRRMQPSGLSRAPQPPPAPRQASSVTPGVRSAHAEASSGGTPRQPARASQPPNLAPVSPNAARQLPNGGLNSQTSGIQPAQLQLPTRQSAPSQPAVAQSAAIPPHLPPQSTPFQQAPARRRPARRGSPLGSQRELATASRPRRNGKSAEVRPKRATVFLGASLVAVFLVTATTLKLFDASARPSSTQDTRTTKVDGFSARHSQIERTDTSPSRDTTPASPKTYVAPARPARPAVSEPDPARSDESEPESQMAADTTPIADPSTFGSEAKEPIYAN